VGSGLALGSIRHRPSEETAQIEARSKGSGYPRWELCTLGLGDYLRYLLLTRSLMFRISGGRTVCNAWFYCLFSRRLPGFVGEMLYQSMPRLSRCFARNGVQLIRYTSLCCFLGFPVFIYLRIRERNRSAHPPPGPGLSRDSLLAYADAPANWWAIAHPNAANSRAENRRDHGLLMYSQTNDCATTVHEPAPPYLDHLPSPALGSNPRCYAGDRSVHYI